MYSAYILLVVISVAVVPEVSANALGCKMACKKCKDKVEYPSIVTVYCEMCDECKAKRDQKLKMALRYESTLPEITPEIIQVSNVAGHTPSKEKVQAENEVHQTSRFSETVEVDNLSDCPPPPPCEPKIIKLTVKPTTTTTTTTPMPRRCPPAPRCVLRKTTPCPPPPMQPMPLPMPVYPYMQPAMPAMPMYQYMPPMPPMYAYPPPPILVSSQAPVVQTLTPAVVKLSASVPLAPSPPPLRTTGYLSVFIGIPKAFSIDYQGANDEDSGVA